MQGKDVQAPCETHVFTGTWLLLLWIPFSADHSMGSRRALSEEHVPNTRKAMGPFQISDTPFQGKVIILNIDF